MVIFLFSKTVEIIKKDVRSDGLSSKSTWIEVGFGLFLSNFESDYFLSDSNRIILSRIGSDLYRIRLYCHPYVSLMFLNWSNC